MPPIERLPTEIVQYIAELCTWDSAPPENGFVSEIDLQRYKSKGEWHLASYARYHAAFARTNRHFYDILNERLYARNMSRDPQFYSCLRWAVHHNRLETIKRAHQYRLDLSSFGQVPCTVEFVDSHGLRCCHMKVNGVLMPDSMSDREFNKAECWFSSPLWDAVFYGHLEIVDFLLDAKVDVEKETPYVNYFPLESALDQGNEKLAEKLVAHGAYRLQAGLSALPLAKAKGFHGIVETLFQRNDPTTLVGKLHIGASSNDLELVAQCLEDPRVDVNAKDLEENTALRLAIKSAKVDLEVIKLILRHPKVQVSIPDGIENAPIHLAALNGRMDIVRLLAAMPDFDINCRTVHRDTVLQMAAQAAGVETFTYFLNHPDLENPTRGDLYDLLRFISQSKDDDVQAEAMLQLLLRAGHQLEPSCYDLYEAIEKGNLLTASKLLSLISQAELLNHDRGVGPLHRALVKHHPLVTTLIGELLARDVDIEIPANTWKWAQAPGDCTARPLFFATVFAKNPDCMKMLLEAGANATSTVRVQVCPVWRGGPTRTMSLLSGLLSYVWRKRRSIVRHPIQHPISADSAIQEYMFELEYRVSLLLQHGATLNQVSSGPSALRLVCLEAVESSSLDFLKWVMDNATTSNVSIKEVDLLLSEFALVEDMQVQSEIHDMLKGFKERLLRDGTQD